MTQHAPAAANEPSNVFSNVVPARPMKVLKAWHTDRDMDRDRKVGPVVLADSERKDT